MKKDDFFLSIIIPFHNNFKPLTHLLSSISDSDFDDFNRIEVLIVDDGSKKEQSTKLESLNKKRKFILRIFHLNKNSGPAKTRNFGVKHALGKYIVFFDADVFLKKNTLAAAYDFFKKKKGRAFTGIWDKRQKTKSFFPQYKALRDHCYWFIEREREARYYLFSTRVAGIEKKLFDKIGGFNTNYPLPTVEDIELTYKIERETKITFVPEIIVTHEFEDFLTLSRKYFLRSRDWVKLYFKRLRFDPVATSKREANKSTSVGIFALLFVIGLLLNLKIVMLLSLIFFSYFFYLELPFLIFLYKEKGLLFTLKAIPTGLILYLIIDAGSFWGLVEDYLFKKR